MATGKKGQMRLYQKIAQHFQGSIEKGSLVPGDKMPSLRRVKEQFGVSLTTAVEAYRLLEDMDLIQSHPRSAYTVNEKRFYEVDEPLSTKPPAKASYVKTVSSDIMMDVLADKNYIPLGAAVCNASLFPEKQMVKMFKQSLDGCLGNIEVYSPISGRHELEKFISQRFSLAMGPCDPKKILITNGANEAVFMAIQAITKPGDVVAIESPSYFSLIEMLKANHLKVMELPTDPRQGIDLTILERRLKKGAINAIFLMPNFQNPAGHAMPDQNKKKLVDLVTKYQIPVVEDDVYGELSFSGKRPSTLKSYDREGWVIHCNSFSKSLAPGMRIGWCVPGRFFDAIWHIKRISNIATSTAPQLAMVKYLKSHSYTPYIKNLRKILAHSVSSLRFWLAQSLPSGTKITNPEGGHVLWVECDPDLDSQKLFSEALKKKITLAPGTLFSASGLYGNCFRLNAGNPPTAVIKQAVEDLAGLIRRQIE